MLRQRLLSTQRRSVTRLRGVLRQFRLLALLSLLFPLVGCKCETAFNFEVVKQGGQSAPRSPLHDASVKTQDNNPGSHVQRTPAGEGPVIAERATTGETAMLRGKGKAQVPLHPSEGAEQVSLRVADGTEVTILERGQKANWLLVRTPRGETGWVVERYVERAPRARASAGSASLSATAKLLPAGSPWRSLADCETAVAAGKRRERVPGSASVGTWNLRWFPDGVPGGNEPKRATTDIAWLGCLISYLDVDVLAAQELKTDAHTKPKWQQLLKILDKNSKGDWGYTTDVCTGGGRQHVGVLYNKRRVKLQPGEAIAAFNPNGGPCTGNLRPGFDVYARFNGGLDLHLISVHLKSGPEAASYAKRRASYTGFARAYAAVQGRQADSDVIVLGDFNTMGCEDCAPAVAAKAERDLLEQAALAAPQALELRGGVMCSHYYKREPGLLDHFLIAKEMQELSRTQVPKAYGLCEIFSCGPLPGEPPEVHRQVSDHCPLILDIPDRDQD